MTVRAQLAARVRAAVDSVVRRVAPVRDGRTSGAERTRRSDWLVLLPEPRADLVRVVALGSSSAERRHLAEHFGVDGVAATVDDRGDHSGGVDVLIAHRTSHAETVAAVAHLARDGVGILLDALDSPSRAHRLLDETGNPVVVSSRHGMLPNAVAPTRFVPLASASGVRWYLRHLFITTNRIGRVASLIASWNVHVMRVAISAQAIVVTGSAVPSLRPGDVSIGSQESPTMSDAIVLTSGHHAGSRTVIVPFEDDARVPRRVLKIAGTRAVNAATTGEHVVLAEVRASLPHALRATLPTPLGEFEWRSRAGVIESAFDGPTMTVALGENTSPEVQIALLDRVAEWTTRFAAATGDRVAWDDETHERWIASSIRRASGGLDVSPDVAAMFDQLVQASLELRGSVIPIVRRHFDLGPWNLVCVDDGVGVIDWETGPGRPAGGLGLPLCDLDYFGKYWLHAVGRHNGVTDELRLFAWGTHHGDGELDALRLAVRAAVETSRRELEIDERFVPVVVAQHWIDHAARVAELRTRLGSDGPPLRPAEAYLGRLASLLSF